LSECTLKPSTVARVALERREREQVLQCCVGSRSQNWAVGKRRAIHRRSGDGVVVAHQEASGLDVRQRVVDGVDDASGAEGIEDRPEGRPGRLLVRLVALVHLHRGIEHALLFGEDGAALRLLEP
jgi:hypothetical protein